MAAAKIPLAINQGATFAKRLTWTAGAPAVAVDLTGCTARMQIREAIDSATAACTLTTENGGITLGGVAGTIDILIAAIATAAFAFEKAVYDLEIIMSDGITVHRLAGGAVTVSPEVTR